MKGLWTMLKANLKLVLRSKQALLLILMIPILSTCILDLTTIEEGADPDRAYKMETLIIDASESALSEALIDRITDNDYMIAKIEKGIEIKHEDLKNDLTQRANQSEAACFIYIPKDFEDRILKGNRKESLYLFETGADERWALLDMNLNTVLNRFYILQEAAEGKEETFWQLFEEVKNSATDSEKILINKDGKSSLENKKGYSFSLGMFAAALTITLIFSNNFIVGLFIKEKQNKVIKRIKLTHANMFTYTLAKIITAVGVLIIQTSAILAGIKVIVKLELGIPLWMMGLLIFGLGLVLSCVCICCAAVFEHLSTANYAGLAFIIIGNMLAGLYFPLEVAPGWMQNAAMLLPQKWFVFSADKLLQGNNLALIQYGGVMMAFMIFFLAVSLLGFKVNKNSI